MDFFFCLQTFRPKKRFEPGTMKFNLHKQANASLNSGIDLKEVVKLPPGEDMNDWIAVHGGYIYTCKLKLTNEDTVDTVMFSCQFICYRIKLKIESIVYYGICAYILMYEINTHSQC